jgi:uncharacterized protein (DUF885 family)
VNRNFFSLCLVLVVGCARLEPAAPSSASDDAAFTRVSEEFLAGYLAWRPQTGTALGLHEYDGKITDYSRGSIEAERARLMKFERRLAQWPVQQLGAGSHHDLRLLQAAVRGELFRFDAMHSYTRNPMTYAGAFDVNIYIKRDFAPLEQRVGSVVAILRQAPKLLADARANLEPSLAKPFIETAIEVAGGSADFLGKDLVDALKDVKNPVLMAEFNAANQRAVTELRAFVKWLEQERLPRAHARYALGRADYARMLRNDELLTLTPERVLEIGMAELKREQAAFAEAARQIDPAKKPIEVFKEIQKDHPTEQGLIPDTKKNLEGIRQFLIDRKIVSMPTDVRVRVEETPQFARATSFASMDTPGPFETKATEAYYYVTPPDAKDTPEKKDEWLTAFNYYTTDIVSIHEAYPGHYLQFIHLNASSANRLRKILTSYAFTEGWAHYTEKMAVDEGFGLDNYVAPTAADRLRAAKYRLAQSDEALLRLCRLCVSIRIHCQGMTVEEGTKFFEDNCYYEQKPARSEAIRGSYDPGYLYYTLGKLQVLKLRRDWQAQEGAKYSLQGFHDEMLRHGAPPIRLLREIMLQDRTQWNEVF